MFHAKAILFDMDGTLVDSTAAIHRAWKWWTAKRGIPLGPVLAVEKGRPNREIIAQFAPHLDIEEESRRFVAFETEDNGGVSPIPGAVEALRMASHGQWAIVTSARRTLAEVRLKAAGISAPDVLVTFDDVTNGKPDPECFLLAAQRLGISPGDCLVFEDAKAGLMASRRAGMAAISISANLEAAALASANVQDFREVSIKLAQGGGFEIAVQGLNYNAATVGNSPLLGSPAL